MKIVDYVFAFYDYFSMSRRICVTREVNFARRYLLYVAEN